jgi:type IV pilus assembly protein PilN
MRIDINLATRPYEDSRQFWTYWATGLGLLALVTALLIFMAATGYVRAGHDRRELDNLQSQIAAYDREKGDAEAVLNQPQNRELREQSQFLNRLFERKSFSWTRVFEDLEQVMPAHLHVISIHPASTDNNVQLKLVVGGDSHVQALDLVRKMESSKHFKQTKIVNEGFATEQSPTNDRVTFDIEAVYTPWDQPNQTSGGMH